jgi:hypothetical protein
VELIEELVAAGWLVWHRARSGNLDKVEVSRGQARRTSSTPWWWPTRAGASTRELAVQFSVWRGTVGRHLQTRGIDTRPSALRLEGAQEAAKQYREG